MTEEPLKIVLHFMYSDQLLIKTENYDLPNNEKISLLMNIYIIAQELKIKYLEEQTIQYLQEYANCDNVLDILKSSHLLKLDLIKKICLRFIMQDDNYNTIILTDEYASLVFKNPDLILELTRAKLSPISFPETKGNFFLLLYYQKLVHAKFMTAGTTLKEDMKSFLILTGQDLADINLLLDEKSISVHKTVLAARSNYFKQLFGSIYTENETIKVSNFLTVLF